jgi:hypothetical protein
LAVAFSLYFLCWFAADPMDHWVFPAYESLLGALMDLLPDSIQAVPFGWMTLYALLLGGVFAIKICRNFIVFLFGGLR